ncbi:Hypothetical protein AA314_03323 [Archangium gephyra]|uniref:Uncharacterized protein n=1 Tax=Archangium gephyra TaxID=48 RepID=A0AAC8TD74_9BACT|nr:Hypothetical protein AA314_03323 [Archangium gephyra]
MQGTLHGAGLQAGMVIRADGPSAASGLLSPLQGVDAPPRGART